MPVLLVRQTDGTTAEFQLEKLRTTIGRSSRNDVCLSDPFASRLHAEVRREGEAYFINDLGSANGTFFNGARLSGGTSLKFGDVVRIGETELRLGEANSSGTNSTSIQMQDVDWSLRAEATIVGRGQANKEDSLLSVFNEMTARRSGDRTGLLIQPTAVPEKQRDLLAIVSKVVETLLSENTLDETLRLILDLVFDAVPAQRGYIFLAGRNGELLLKAARSLEKSDDVSTDEVRISRAICDKVFGECISVLTSDAAQDPRFVRSNSILLSQIRSIMAVPLALGDEVLGMIYVDNPYATNRFTEDDLGVVTTIARVAAVKIENARLMEAQLEKRRMDEELKVASEIQLSLHPATPPRIPGYDLVGISFPCREIGGDYFDFIRRKNGNLLVALGDVSGKGIGAALLMSSLHAAIRAQALTGGSVDEIVSQVNTYITENSPENKFLTLICAEMNPTDGTLSYTNAGHNPAFIVRPDLSVERLSAAGVPVGITVDMPYIAERAALRPGDVLVVYSDGVTESLNERDEEFGEDRLLDVIRRHQKSSASRIRDRIDEAVGQFVGRAPTSDDMTLVILKRLDG